MQRIALLILCLAAVGCDKKVVKSVDVPVEDVAVEEALTEDVLANAALVCSGSLQLPTGAGVLAEDLQVYSLYDEATPNAAGAFSISMADIKNPQFVFAIDPATDNSLLLGYVDPLQGEQVQLSCESTAVSLAFLTPLMIGTTAEQRSEFIKGIKAHPKFSLLVEAVEAALQADPQQVLDDTAHPELYEQAVEISVEVWQQMTAAGKLLAPAATQTSVCEDNKEANVWITDEPGNGNKIVFCNPKMVYYVAMLIGDKDDIEYNEDFEDFEFNHSTFSDVLKEGHFIDIVDINPKRSAITPRVQLKFWNVGTHPQFTEYTLPIDGTVNYDITRGYSFGADGNWSFDWRAVTNWNEPYGRASLLNIVQGLLYLYDLLGLIVPKTPGMPVATAAPNIAKFLGTDASILDRLGEMVSVEVPQEGTSTFDVIKSFASIIGDLGTEVIPSMEPELWGNLSLDPKKMEDLNNSRKLVKKLTNVLENTTKVLGLYDYANVTVPFFVDLFAAWPKFSGQFGHTEGIKGPPIQRKEGEEPEQPWREETFELLGEAEMTMVWVEPGDFEMGSDDSYYVHQGPAHQVKISAGFWLGSHEVTQAQWYEVMGTTPWEGQPNVREEPHPSYPATYISWEDVQEFIARLNAAAGERRYRLPTEAEWEYACRAGSSTPWSFGDDVRQLTDYAWYNPNWGPSDDLANPLYPQIVKLKRANAWGLHDMHGNVAEWVQDWYDPDYYKFSPLEDPQGASWPFPDSDPRRVARGGSIFHAKESTQSARRRYYSPDTRRYEIGFRLVRLEEAEALEEPNELPMWTFELPRGAELEMMWIKPGAFEMGSSDEPNASPPHEVEISEGFWLGAYEVTQAQWEAVMEGTAWAAPWAAFGVASESAYPATYISWEAAQEFIARLNAAAGERWYRLPTEAEWEYACRAGTQTRWSFGDDSRHLNYFAWYLDGDVTGVQAVGLKRANAWGLRDMHGNAAEWVQDWYDAAYYANSPVLDPQGPSWPPFDYGPWRVIRGGSFYDGTGRDTRSASRSADTNDYTGAFTGFRLVRGATPQEPPTQTISLPGGTEMAFVRVEPGVFQMGSDNGDANEKPVHEVEISTGFWMGQYEVTKAQWEAVMEPPSNWSSRWAVLSESHPAIGISWNAAQAFIDSLNTAAGERRYRLPTEAEWEYACRAGMPTRWSFGDDVRRLEHYAWYRENASGVNEVGQKRPNFWGLYDMHGNVQEWVQDWYSEDYYAESPVLDPAGPDTGNARVRRGGIYSNEAQTLRSAHRTSSDPSNEDVSFGFRLLMLDEPEELPVEEPEEPPVDGGGAVGEERTFSLPGGAEMEFVWIEPGVFQMGGSDSDEVPVHEVEISKGFYLGKYEITQGQWEAVMGETPWSGEDYVQEHPSHPAVYISWEDVQTFIGRLNAAAGDSLYRLPTEAEWEYACRAGTTTFFSFGNDVSELTDYAWYDANALHVGEEYAHAVGLKLPNAWGLYDMHGNVLEWVQDWYGEDYYNSSPRVDPLGPYSGTGRVIRGGAFGNDVRIVRSSYRGIFSPGGRHSYVGARLVRIGKPGEVLIDPPEEVPEEVPPVDEGGAVGEESTFSLLGGAEMEVVWIEPGVFQMGATESEINETIDWCVDDLGALRSNCIDVLGDQGPLHEVEISQGFYLGKYEITQGQWEAVMGTTPWTGRDYVREHSSHPAVYISWYDTQAFIGRLNAAAGDSLYRLPSEAEWEYACRAGTQTRWSFGDNENQLGDYAWYRANAWDVGKGYAQPVGTKLPNAWGLYDMHGNVFEWVQDWYGRDYYNSSPRVDPLGPSSGSYRIFRGGDFWNYAQLVRSAYRPYISPDNREASLGLRLVVIGRPGEVPIDPPEEVPEEPPVGGGGAVGEESTFSLPGGAEMEFVWIEPGVFQMGATESEISETIDWCTDLGYSRRACVDLYGAEGPLHEVEISQGFYLGKYEITKSQWLEVMRPTRTPWSSDAPISTFSGLEPATDISWYDVQEFVDRLNDAAGDSLYRLPTEAEWEYACRAGTSTRWSSGDDERELRHYAWYGDNASGVNEVGLKRPNAWGLYDMHGNVWEWVQDWYDADYYNSSPRVDPPGPDSGSYRVIRGGFFSVGTQDLRSAQRSSGSPSTRRNFLGARLVRIR